VYKNLKVLSCVVVIDRYACSLLREGMKQILVTLDSSDIEALEKQGDKEAVAKVVCFSYGHSY